MCQFQFKRQKIRIRVVHLVADGPFLVSYAVEAENALFLMRDWGNSK